MAHDPLFSIVMPTYNRGNLILRTLETVFSQTYQHFEIIVVDDCSTDNTAQVLEPLIQSGKIRYFRNEQNYERAHSRNTGMTHARGEFLTFLDSDDLMYRTNLEDAAAYVRENPDTKLFQNEYQLVDEHNNVLCKYPFPSLEDPVRAITGGNFMSCIGDFLHREIYEKYRFDPSPVIVSTEDWLFWINVLADYGPGRINKINNGVVYHTERSINQLDLERLHNARHYLVNAIKSDPHLMEVYEKHLNRFEAAALFYAATVANRMCRHAEAFKLILKAASLDFRMVGSINFMKAFGIAVLRINKGF